MVPSLNKDRGTISNYKSTKKGKVRLLWQPQQLLSIPGTQGRQAWVIIVPIVVVIIGADQIAMPGLLVMGHQVIVWETLEGHKQSPLVAISIHQSNVSLPAQDKGSDHLPRISRGKKASIGHQRLLRATELSISPDPFLFQLYTPARCFHISGQVHSPPG